MKIKKKISKQTIFSIISSAFIVIAHIAILLAIILSFRYYSIYPSLFGSIVAIILCLLIIIDIVFFVGLNHKDIALKIVSTTLAVLLLLGGSVGTYLIAKANGIVDSVLDSGSGDKYETYSGVFACYDKYNKFTALSDLKGKKVGMLAETSDGISYLAKEALKAEGIDCGIIEYKTNTELVTALVDNNIDAMVITSTYKQMYSLERDENSPFAQYLDNFIDFNSFEKELKVQSNKKAKNLSTDPFTVLLIGYSRTDIGSPVGLADSIILATINPQTYTVSMMSIARDSFVPIPCYGGEYDKINSGRSTSRQCFIDTVEEFVGMDIDYYMELDYYGLILIVDAIGGIHINNPVDFELDGVFVPAGDNVFADGNMALQFCRERHHMPNGDFDRQQHQKEVIISVAKKFIESGDISLALRAMDTASEWMSTDLTLTQLTNIFNLLLNTKNNTSLDTFDLVDFQTLRMTGYGGIMYYSYSMRLPLWVYLIYQGSYDESIGHVKDALGQYSKVNQNYKFEFSAHTPYVRPQLYQTEYPDVFMFKPDPMPAYWPKFEGMKLDEAMNLASEKGVKITVKYITPGSSDYNKDLEGFVVDQSVRYGSLLTEYSTCEITVMGTGELDEDKYVPNFVGHSYTKAIKWAKAHDIPYTITKVEEGEGQVGDVLSQDPKFYTPIEDVETLKIVMKSGSFKVKFVSDETKGTAPESIDIETGDDVDVKLPKPTAKEGYAFLGWYLESSFTNKVEKLSDVKGSNGSTVSLYAKWGETVKIELHFGGDKVETIENTDTFPTPSKEHYTFDGWYTASEGGEQVSDPSTITSNTKLYAHYSPADWTTTSTDNSVCGCNDAPEGKEFSGCTITYNGDNTTDKKECVCSYKDVTPVEEETEEKAEEETENTD